MVFSLLQIETFSGIFFSIGYLELPNYNGALFHIGKRYHGIWEIDFFWFNIIRTVFRDWLDSP